jgi:glycosyltransferase involved in cell wall biosynthesis
VPFEASRVLVVDLDRPLLALAESDAAGRWHGRARLLLRRGGRPVDVLDVELPVDLADVLDRVAPVDESVRPTATATVAIATRDRPTSLARCLDTVLALDHPDFDVVVVDNAPSDCRARAVAERFGVSYVWEGRPGLARAHNAALPHVTGEVVAFTDDDVEVDPQWLRRLTEAFDDPRVACVTGMIFPAEVETPAQAWIEAHAGFGKGFERQVFDLDEHRPDDRLFPFTAGRLGSGANMAFRTSTLCELGGFDPTLGVGTPARGGDDLAAFYDVIRSGHRLVYEPAALVLHHHHQDSAAVRRLAYSYGIGLSAYLTRAVVEEPKALLAMAARLPGGVRHGLRTTRPPQDVAVPGLAGAGWRQRLGMVVGPWSYARSRRSCR